MKKKDFDVLAAAIVVFLIASPSILATVATVQDQDQRSTYTARPSEKAFIYKTASKDALVSTMTAGYTQGVDSNPLLDSTHKADNFSQESFDMFFKYPIKQSDLGALASRFGISVLNINYYRINDVNTFDGFVIAKLEQEVGKNILLTAGYSMECLIFPHSDNGNYIGNEANAVVQHKLLDWMYHKGTYRFISRGYLERTILLNNGNPSSELRKDERNLFEYEFGMYLANSAKFKIVNQFYMNRSNYQYMDYYNYNNFRTGGSIIQFFTKKLYHITGFYYSRRDYLSRTVSVGDYTQKDNLYIVTASLMYDFTKNFSGYFNYMHTENHTNEPLEQYVDTMYTVGCYYSF